MNERDRSNSINSKLFFGRIVHLMIYFLIILVLLRFTSLNVLASKTRLMPGIKISVLVLQYPSILTWSTTACRKNPYNMYCSDQTNQTCQIQIYNKLMLIICYIHSGRPSDLKDRMLVSGLSDLGSNHGREHCVVLSSKALSTSTFTVPLSFQV